MRQVLLTVPPGIPIFGYGAMLFLAFVGCTWLGTRLGRRVGIAPEVFKDLGVWLFVFGILGARLFHFIFEVKHVPTPWEFLAVWDGGLVFYGSVPGGLIGFLVADFVLQRKYPYDRWKLLDCLAPCIALGLALGRIGCLLNGCCYGNVACDHCPAITFPYSAPPRFTMVERGYQTTTGFGVERDRPWRIDYVEPGSAAEAAGVKVGDTIKAVNGVSLADEKKDGDPRRDAFARMYEAVNPKTRGKNDLLLTLVAPDGAERTLDFTPRTVGLHPAQIYETISMTLMLFFLVSYFPYRPADGSLMVILMLGYGVHRFLNEMLRTDTEKVAFDLTLSQNISILVLIGGAVLGVAVYLHAQRSRATA